MFQVEELGECIKGIKNLVSVLLSSYYKHAGIFKNMGSA